MATPAQPIQSAVGTEGSGYVKSLPFNNKPITVSWKKFSQHYITNNNSASAPAVTYHTNAASLSSVVAFPSFYYAVFDQGYFNIPFTSTTMAATAEQWDSVIQSAAKLRIKSLGFEIVSCQCIQSDVTPAAGTTNITNRFANGQKLMLVIDHNHILASNSTVGNTATATPSNLFDLIASPGTANTDFVTSAQSAGFLPQVRTLQACSAGTTGFDPNKSYSVPSHGEIVWLESGMRSVNGRNIYEYHWTNPDTERWTAPNRTANRNPLQDETVVSGSYYQPGFSGTIANQILANMGTDVYRNLTDLPKHHLLKNPPVLGSDAPLYLTFEFKVNYYMEVEYVPIEYLQTRNILGSDSTSLAGNLLPGPLFRRSMLTFGDANPFIPTLESEKDQNKGKRKYTDKDEGYKKLYRDEIEE